MLPSSMRNSSQNLNQRYQRYSEASPSSLGGSEHDSGGSDHPAARDSGDGGDGLQAAAAAVAARGPSSPDERRVAVFEIQDGSPVDSKAGGGAGDGFVAEEALVELKLQNGESSASLGEEQIDGGFHPTSGLANGPPEPARAGGWQNAAAHTVAAVFGAGVLSLPYALRWLGLGWGLVLLTVAAVVSYYSSYLLAVLGDSHKAPATTYRELGKRAFGPRLGLLMIVPFQFTVLIGTTIIYLTLGGESLLSIYTTACESRAESASPCPPAPQWAWTLLFTCLCLAVAWKPGIHEVSWVSVLAALMSVTYGTMAIITSAIDLARDGIAGQCGPTQPASSSSSNSLLESFNAIGIIVFAYGGHSVLPEIQATIRPNPTTVQPMMKGISAAYAPTTLIYFTLAIVGHLAYGDCTNPNVLLSAASGDSSSARLIAAVADLLVTIHVFGSIQVYSQPIMQAIQAGVRQLLPQRSDSGPAGGALSALRSPSVQRWVINISYISFLGVLAALLPDASGVIGLIGGIAITWMTFVVPSVMTLVSSRPAGSTSWPALVANAIIVIVCSLLGLLATVGAGYRLSVSFVSP